MNETLEKKRTSRKTRRLPLWATFALDALVLIAALNVFALFHHVIPRAEEPAELLMSAIPTPEPAPVAELAARPAETFPAETETSEETETPAEEKTGWARTFAERFTDEVVITENSYSSPDISVTVTEHVYQAENRTNAYFVADIYIADIRCFRTALAKDTFGHGMVEDIRKISADNGALAAVTGDFYSYQNCSLVLRNGVLYRDGRYQTGDSHCVLYYDGTMVTYAPYELDLEEAMANGAWQIWTFGPALLDGEGNIPTSFAGTMAVNDVNPRAAVGYYEPGHYCFVVASGRGANNSLGLTFRELAEVFYDLGCTTAYNLDGGGSAAMTFMDERVNVPSGGGRDLSDVLLIAEIQEAAPEEASADEVADE